MTKFRRQKADGEGKLAKEIEAEMPAKEVPDEKRTHLPSRKLGMFSTWRKQGQKAVDKSGVGKRRLVWASTLSKTFQILSFAPYNWAGHMICSPLPKQDVQGLLSGEAEGNFQIWGDQAKQGVERGSELQSKHCTVGFWVHVLVLLHTSCSQASD